jgi:hypothetical protein
MEAFLRSDPSGLPLGFGRQGSCRDRKSEELQAQLADLANSKDHSSSGEPVLIFLRPALYSGHATFRSPSAFLPRRR